MDEDVLAEIVRATIGDNSNVQFGTRQEDSESCADITVSPGAGRTATIQALGEVSHLRLDEGIAFTLVAYEPNDIADSLRQLTTLAVDYLRGEGTIEYRRRLFVRRPVLNIVSGGYTYEVGRRWSRYGESS